MNNTTRRKFIKNIALSTFAINYIPSIIRGKNVPSNKLNIAAVGVGGMGGANLRMLENENIVALCDVDFTYAANTFKRYPNAKIYKDYRIMLEKEKNIDAVLIATPDHTHAVITMAAMQEGKHVFCQKPLTHNIYEARKIMEAAKYYGVQTQMGNQGHSSDHIRILKEWIEDGAIGNVREVHAWTDRPVGGDPWSTFLIKSMPTEKVKIPDELDWDLWLGPAMYRDYHPDYHPTNWRSWIDFGTGSLGDMGCHILDPAFWALDLFAPTSIEATSTHWEPEIASQTFPRASIVRYIFPANDKRNEIKLTWYDGRLMPPIPEDLEIGRNIPASGAFIIGDKGVIMHGSHGADNVRIIPESKMKEYKLPPKKIPRIKGSHEDDWLRACKEGKNAIPASSNFEYGGALTEMVLLGMIAIQVKDKNLKWNANEMKFENNDEANNLINTQYREGWKL
ncbi:MAG: Gfo/Idh/MocA family oxidoreductase [Ignavibacteriae bacterium]|nr:Gfo/Idh/MocA family oxidoreductase [Ignavibacteriota bacterium]